MLPNYRSCVLVFMFTATAAMPMSADQPEVVDGGERHVAQAPFDVEVRGTGQPMILIPGLSCGGEVWADTVDHFQDRYECHVLTLAGFAGQPPIAGPLLPQVRDGVVTYIRDKKLDNPVIVGHSMGGLLAFWIAARAPENVGPVISVDGIPFYSALHFPEATPDDMRSWAEKKRAFLQSASRSRSIIQNRIALASMVSDQQDLQELATMLDRCDTETVGQATYELMTTDVRDELSSIQTPVLLIGATGSSTSPEDRQQKEDRYRQQVSSIPQHEVLFHSESRHFIQYDAPEFLWREMERFLREHTAQ